MFQLVRRFFSRKERDDAKLAERNRVKGRIKTFGPGVSGYGYSGPGSVSARDTVRGNDVHEHYQQSFSQNASDSGSGHCSHSYHSIHSSHDSGSSYEGGSSSCDSGSSSSDL